MTAAGMDPGQWVAARARPALVVPDLVPDVVVDVDVVGVVPAARPQVAVPVVVPEDGKKRAKQAVGSVLALRRNSEVERAWERRVVRFADEDGEEDDDEWDRGSVCLDMYYPSELYERVVCHLKGLSRCPCD